MDEAANILYIGGNTLCLPPIVNSPNGSPIIRRTSIIATARSNTAPIIEQTVEIILLPLYLLRIDTFIENEGISCIVNHLHHLFLGSLKNSRRKHCCDAV